MINLSVLGANPYVQNHHLRVIGVAITFFSIIISNFLLVYFEASTSGITSSWGIFFVQPVKDWHTWWNPAQQTICEIATNSTLLEGYEWKDAYKTTFADVDASTLCSSVFKLMIVAMVTGFVMIACPCVLAVLVTYSKMQGDPEFNSHPYYAHCKFAMGIVMSCTIIIIFCAAGFMAVFNITNVGTKLSFTMREAGLVTIAMSLTQGLVVFAYQRDRALLSTKFEFERLDWRQVDDTKEAYRKLMQYDMERLQAAKFGGLQSPQEVARQSLNENLEGHDKFVLQHLNPW
ncbi:putative transmembrane protein [Toxoplasma gondii TgCatPRC2]|uniref:Transmembrane protein n=15 Tax=Toxoplasma gondii TaxID=5811 RepID=A0A125YRS3_TOXGG|nr:hypothetical protein TGME49_224620 [Toxoplasma gondii ME49]EPR62112.1 hypothetical protein TGGT1_224620 [Toxoplasma gondii GT1]ESS32471.1 putative transmembrane protein [Toxoplasma gondii VEG]KAF4640503.1 hypothetical protein TGRH88_044290 [Toxoplasma gondii]KFG43075.1 putative transmembrane protein [Toxoplasma gondii p89]KFG45668.1 putative transmembrane protein [Toxoplasma gondii GAB2-2007-GAL-DOM2]KFG55010.1 putative transmembrane protein [Toxoplasma gondii FOU]KFG60705.1 putative tran|eukprot:XP_002366136.1 hypothetical protein TGME49_224620 [Toxoplasma gondii ME49]